MATHAQKGTTETTITLARELDASTLPPEPAIKSFFMAAHTHEISAKI